MLHDFQEIQSPADGADLRKVASLSIHHCLRLSTPGSQNSVLGAFGFRDFRVGEFGNGLFAERPDVIQKAPLPRNRVLHYEDDVFGVQGFLEPLDLLADLVGHADDLKPVLEHLFEGLRNLPVLSLHTQRFEKPNLPSRCVQNADFAMLLNVLELYGGQAERQCAVLRQAQRAQITRCWPNGGRASGFTAARCRSAGRRVETSYSATAS